MFYLFKIILVVVFLCIYGQTETMDTTVLVYGVENIGQLEELILFKMYAWK